ncbi:MAG: virulence factor, partial [Spirochaetaceae bacterium]|nr:virulence factor [Spirochaetaceae bacterium]
GAAGGGGGPAGGLRVAWKGFRDTPRRVRVAGAAEEIRRGLGRRFDAAVKRAMPAARNPLMERRWVDLGTRYGDSEEVADSVTAEVRALYDSDRLAWLTDRALSSDQDEPEAKPDRQRLIGDLEDPDWRARYRALRRLGSDAGLLPKIIALAGDAHLSVRRQAIVLLGLSRDERAEAPLRDALRAPIAAVRRTAGDALNDLGNPEVAGAIAETLADNSALVRWRAARFLFELGDDRALPSLRAARDDQGFEGRMQIEQAIERIESGARPEGPVWQRMTRSDREP